MTTQRQIAVEWVTKYLQDSGRKNFKHDPTYVLFANTVYERGKNVIASFACKNTSSTKQNKISTYTVEKANLNCRASMNFLLPCQEGQPN